MHILFIILFHSLLSIVREFPLFDCAVKKAGLEKQNETMERKESPPATLADQGGDNRNTAPEPKINPATGRPALPRAPKACARCRRQKLRVKGLFLPFISKG